MSARDDQLSAEAELPDLFELFEPHRPDAGRFRAGVARRIEELRRRHDERSEGHPKEEAHDGRAESSGWRRAAALFLAPTNALGAAQGKSAQALAAILALPVLLLGSAVGASLAAARSIRRSGREAVVPDDTTLSPHRAWNANRELRTSSRLLVALQFGGVLAFFLSWFFGSERMVDGILVVLLVSMGALVLRVRGLSRAGLLFRSATAAQCTGLLVAVLVGCVLWTSAAQGAEPVRGPGVAWSLAVVTVGIALCLVSSRETRAGIVILVPLAPLCFVLTWAQPLPDPGARHQLERLVLDPADLTDWDRALALFEALTSTGAPVPDLAPATRELERASRSGVEVHPMIWTAAARMGLVERETWRALAGRRLEAMALDHLLEDRPVLQSESYEYRIHMLLAARSLSAAELEHLAARVEKTWPAPETRGPSTLDQAASCLRLLDLLGRSDLVEPKREPALELVASHWIGKRGLAGFTPDPSQYDVALDGATWNGVQLMRRFGIPAQVDLETLHASLAKTCRPARGADVHRGYAALERASLHVVENGIGLSPRPPYAFLLDARLLITLTLLVALCLLAIAQTPPEPRFQRTLWP